METDRHVLYVCTFCFFFFQAEDGIRDHCVTGVQTCALPIYPATKRPRAGEYTAGWIKRGPSGVIGTNKPDAGETVALMLEDAKAGSTLHPPASDRAAIERLVRERQPRCVSYPDWKMLDRLEVERGRPSGRPRVKFCTVEEMLKALGR